MMTHVQQELIHVLGQILDVAPEYRVGQLVTNLPMLVGQDSAGATAVIEDEELLQAARMHLEHMVARANAHLEMELPS